MNKHYIYIGLFFLLLSFSIVSSQPSTIVQSFPEGYTIVEINSQYLKINEDFNYLFYLYNTSSGLKIDNTTATCNFHLTDSQGTLLLEKEKLYQPKGYWYTLINGTYFSEVGYYYYGVDCSDELGGALSGVFTVTHTGKEEPTEFVLLFFILGFIAIFFFGIIYFFKALKEFTLLEMDLFDTIILMCSYFIMWLFYYFQMIYLNNPLMNEFLLIGISIGAFTHVLLPLIGLFTSFILNTLKFQQKQRVTY